MLIDPQNPAASFAAEADHARDIAERMTSKSLKQRWLQIESSYRALANGSLTARELGIVPRDIA
jgi:hypothetical protein